MRIGLVLPYLKRRGTEKQALRLAAGLRKKGCETVVFNIQGWGEFAEEFEKNGVKVVDVGLAVNPGKKIVDSTRSGELARLILQERCDVILSRANLSHPVAIQANRTAKKPLVLVRSSAIRPLDGTLKYKSKVWIRTGLEYRNVSSIVTVSQVGAQHLRKYFAFQKRKVISIPNGVDPVRIRQLSDETTKKNLPFSDFNICFLGSLDIQRKGVDILLESVRQLVHVNSRKEILLQILGTGEDWEEVKRLVRTLKLENHVILHGEVPNPYPFLKKADLFVLSSRREGMPNSLLEAMSLGVCCLSTDCPTGPSEIIDHDHNGLLVPLESPQRMTSEILGIMDDETRRIELGRNAARTIEEKFTIDRMIDSYHRLLSRLTN